MCGLTESVKDKPYLFFFDLAKCANPNVISRGCPTHQVFVTEERVASSLFPELKNLSCALFQVCVASCPNETFIATVEAGKMREDKVKQKMICKENVTLASYSVQQLVDQGLCAAYYMQSKPSMLPFIVKSS